MKKQKEGMTFNEKTAVALTTVGGSMPFFWVIVIWYTLWILWNSFAPTKLRFDGQWFPLLLFISNLIQILYMPILQVGQNIIQRHSQTRSESEYKLIFKIDQLVEQIETLEKNQNQISIGILKEVRQLKNEFQIKKD
jgi:uncharacterized membrane protein